MAPSVRRVAARFLAAKSIDLAHHNLEGLTSGTPVTLYHGTTAMFKSFDMNKSRDELVDRFYGKGIFLTPSKRVAAQYAGANRNIGFDPSIISDLSQVNRNAGDFLRAIYTSGRGVWETYARKAGFWSDNPQPGQGAFDSEGFQKYLGGVDANTIADIAQYILGSKVSHQTDDSLALFGESTGSPSWVYDQLDEVGLDSRKYRPKIYTVSVTVSNPLLTASKSEARKARSNGYDCVVFYGTDLVGGVPEVAVFDSHKVKVVSVVVVD